MSALSARSAKPVGSARLMVIEHTETITRSDTTPVR
ncbi:hypothetical protein STANM309S_03543 [Streptomyces tanashiensis]